jgi:hypothetical protein
MKSEYIGVYAVGRTWRDAWWHFLGCVLLHPIAAAKSIVMAWQARGKFDKVRLIRIERTN